MKQNLSNSLNDSVAFNITDNEDGGLSLAIEKLLKKERLSEQIPNENITN